MPYTLPLIEKSEAKPASQTGAPFSVGLLALSTMAGLTCLKELADAAREILASEQGEGEVFT